MILKNGGGVLYFFVRGIMCPLVYFLFRLKVEGRENFPTSGKTIVYANHISAIDPVVIACVLPRKISFMAKIEIFKNPILAWIFRKAGVIPVKRGKADISAIKSSLQVLNKGGVFAIFPEGTRSKDGQLQEFSHGIASIAHRSKAKIIPVAIASKYNYFKPLKIKIGKPLNFESYFEQKASSELLEKMADEMGREIKLMLN